VDAELASAKELLDSTSAGHLAYTAKDGTPRVIPVGFYWTGEQFVISTASTAPKVSALSARPDVALAIDAGGTPEQARALSVRGRADIRIVDGVVEEYLAAARRSMDAEAAAQFEQNCREMYDRMARIAITPRWVRYYDFGAGRMPKFLQELAERSEREAHQRASRAQDHRSTEHARSDSTRVSS
jgi:nitroimidazol reductase NimA-like FMN-containing flavoprotein (pyridoxamine 5'-phosphate oxidase superfamily)